MNNVNLEGGEQIIPFDDVLKGLLNIIKLRNDAIEKAKDLLKNHLIDMFFQIGENEIAEKIIKKGIPDNLIIHGEKTTCYKNAIIFIQTSPIVEKGKLLITWNELPKLATGGLVCNKENESKESFEMRKAILKRNPFPTFADTLPKEKGFVLNDKQKKSFANNELIQTWIAKTQELRNITLEQFCKDRMKEND